MKLKFLIPLGLFIILCGFFIVGLGLDPREVRSPLINKPAPQFTLPELENSDQTFLSSSMQGKVWLLNVWASWCVTCKQEHSILMAIAQSKQIPIVGLNWKDERADALQILKKGNPYIVTAYDRENRVGLNFGVYATPESFLIDKKGIIRYKQIGAITAKAWQEEFMPLVAKLEKE